MPKNWNISTSKIEYLALATIIICAVLVRLSGNLYYYHADELIQNFVVHSNSFAETFQRGMRETHPPLGYFIRHVVFWFNDGLDFNRSLATLLNIGGMFLAYAFGKKLQPNSPLGLVLAALVAFTSISVTYSVSLRNYSLFLTCLMAAYYYFLIYSENQKTSRMLGYIAYTAAACAIHYTGFIFTFALSLALGIQLLTARNYRKFAILVAWHLLHVALLASFAYYFVTKSQWGEDWQVFYAEVMSSLYTKLHISIMSIYFGFFVSSFIFFFIAFPLTLFGLFKLYKSHFTLFLSIIFLFLTQIILSKLHLYPMAGSRYGVHIIPFIIIPLGYAVSYLLAKTKHYILILIFSSLAFSAYAAYNNVYFKNNREMTITKKGFENGLNFITSNTSENDAIIINKGTWLYLLHLQDKTNSGFFPKSFGEYEFRERNFYFLEKNSHWEYLQKKTFYEFLPMVESKTKSAENIWFMIFGTSDFSIFTIYNCESIKPYISNVHIERGVLIFKIDKNFFQSNFFPPSKDVEKCMETSPYPVLGGLFDENGPRFY